MITLRTPSAWLGKLAEPGTREHIDRRGPPALYTARAGWQTAPGPLNGHLLYFVISGSFRARFKGRDEPVNSGDFLWLPPGTEFLSHLPGNQPASFYRFRLTVQNSAGKDIRLGSAPRIMRRLEAVRPWSEEVVRAPDQRMPALQQWRLRGALLGLFADVLAPPQGASARGKLNPYQRETLSALAHVEGAQRLTPGRLATRLRLTPDYFARIFRRTYGVSPRTWIVRERIKLAALRLTESQLSIGEVANEFGYGDIFFFSRQFKQVMGRSPRSYRRSA